MPQNIKDLICLGHDGQGIVTINSIGIRILTKGEKMALPPTPVNLSTRTDRLTMI